LLIIRNYNIIIQDFFVAQSLKTETVISFFKLL